MKRDMDSINFVLPPDMVQFMRGHLSDLQHMSPYDSYIDAHARREDDEYLISILIRHPHGSFAALASGIELDKVFMEAYNEIIRQIRKWHTERFKEDIQKSEALDEPTYIESEWNVGAGPEFKPMSVLVVDDDLESVAPLKTCLDKLNCKVKVVSTGYAAIHEMISPENKYDLMILDWMMPNLDGKQTLLNAQYVTSFEPNIAKHWKQEQMPVITFSGFDRSQIDLPQFKNFKHFDHWKKQGSIGELMGVVSDTLLKLQAPSTPGGTL